MNENNPKKREVHILVAEDSHDQSALIFTNLRRVGITNPIDEFSDDQELLDFLSKNNTTGGAGPDKSYLLLVDVNLPRIGGVEVLRKIKAGEVSGNISVIVIITSGNQPEAEECRQLGFSNFITKPIVYEDFVTAIKKLGFILMIVKAPPVLSTPFTKMESKMESDDK